MNILVVEEEKKVASNIKRGLEEDSYQVTLSYNGVDGLKRATSDEFALIILDCRLQKMNGLTVLHELREAGSQIPVLMLSAKAETEDVVTGLDAGADGYMAKPFVLAELQARVRALIRRSEQSLGADIRFGDVKIDPVNHKVWRRGTVIELAATEYKIFVYFMRNAGTVLSRADIANNCWDHPFDAFTNIVDVYINYLRMKVDGPFPTKLIHTVRGKGYILDER